MACHIGRNSFFTAVIEGKKLRIPYRTNWRSWTGLIGLPQSRKALCLGTRNFDGYVREKNLVKLLRLGDIRYSSLPYVLKLAEEYVVEIVKIVLDFLPRIPDAMFREFFRENPKWIDLMEARATSYWNWYYRPSRDCLNLNDILMEKGKYQIRSDFQPQENLWVREPDDLVDRYTREEYPGMRAVEYLRNTQ